MLVGGWHRGVINSLWAMSTCVWMSQCIQSRMEMCDTLGYGGEKRTGSGMGLTCLWILAVINQMHNLGQVAQSLSSPIMK